MRIEIVKNIIAVNKKRLPNNFPNLEKVGVRIGGGAHGSVYRYGRGRVIKFGIKWASDENFKKLKAFVKKTKRHKAIVNVYNCGRFNKRFYWLVMEHLSKELTSIEENIYLPRFEGYMSRYWYNKPRWAYNPRYDFNQFPKKWKTLLRSMITIKERHIDLHPGNIMRNTKGEPKMIDIESFVWSY